jgi:hypothetical protein
VGDSLVFAGRTLLLWVIPIPLWVSIERNERSYGALRERYHSMVGYSRSFLLHITLRADYQCEKDKEILHAGDMGSKPIHNYSYAAI